jgi:hypothetical protein
MFDFIMIILYTASFALKYYTIFLVRNYKDDIGTEAFWQKVEMLNATDYSLQKDIYSAFYWLNEGMNSTEISFLNNFIPKNYHKKLDRYYWLSFDPKFFSESLFAMANLLSICRFVFLLPANQSIGPLQITLGILLYVCIKLLKILLKIFLK